MKKKLTVIFLAMVLVFSFASIVFATEDENNDAFEVTTTINMEDMTEGVAPDYSEIPSNGMPVDGMYDANGEEIPENGYELPTLDLDAVDTTNYAENENGMETMDLADGAVGNSKRNNTGYIAIAAGIILLGGGFYIYKKKKAQNHQKYVF